MLILFCLFVFFPRRGNTGKGNGDWNIRGQLANCLPGKSQFFYQWQEIGRASKSSCGELEKLVSGHQTQAGQTSEHHSIWCLPTAGGPQPYLDQMSSVWGISMLYNCGFVVGLVSLYMEVLWVPHSSMLRGRTLLWCCWVKSTYLSYTDFWETLEYIPPEPPRSNSEDCISLTCET